MQSCMENHCSPRFGLCRTHVTQRVRTHVGTSRTWACVQSTLVHNWKLYTAGHNNIPHVHMLAVWSGRRWDGTVSHSRGGVPDHGFGSAHARQTSAQHNPIPTHIVAQWLDVRRQQHAFVGLGRDSSFRCHASGCLLGTCLVRGRGFVRSSLQRCTETRPHETTDK